MQTFINCEGEAIEIATLTYDEYEEAVRVTTLADLHTLVCAMGYDSTAHFCAEHNVRAEDMLNRFFVVVGSDVVLRD